MLETNALVLHRVAYSESDWIVTLFTEVAGRVSAITPGARKSKRRYAGGVEPFHGLLIELSTSSRGEMQHLLRSEISHPRHGLVSSLSAMKSAACAFGWLSRALVPMAPDQSIWSLTHGWLDALDRTRPETSRHADARAAEFGLRLLTALGWGLQLQRCVRCDRECPTNRPAHLVLPAGGIVCRSCGGNGTLLNASLRLQLLSVIHEQTLDAENGPHALKIVEAAFAQHAGIE